MSQVVPQPLERSTPDTVFDLPNDDARIAYLKFLGAKNVDPPLAAFHTLAEQGQRAHSALG